MPHLPVARAAALLVASLLAAAALPAQRVDLVVIGGTVRSSGAEFDRVTSTTVPPPFYTREFSERESGALAGITATFPLRGTIYAEIGLLQHGVARTISRTGTGDPSGPFVASTRTTGGIVSLWAAPALRLVSDDRYSISILGGPMVQVLYGDAFNQNVVGYSAPARSPVLGLMIGIRAVRMLGDRIGLQAGLDNAGWTFPITPHPSDGSAQYPDTYRKTPRQNDTRVHAGVVVRLY